MIVKRGDRLVAHLRLANQEMHFGSTSIPISVVSDVATLPEFRGQGFATALLKAADQQMIECGSQLGILRTRAPQFYSRRGWTVCGRHCWSTAKPRDILSHLSALDSSREQKCGVALSDLQGHDVAGKQLSIRLWRHVEQAALLRLYDANMIAGYGGLLRSEPYWRWLISRRGYDRIYVAIEGPDKLELDDQLTPIVGYAAMKDGRIAELMASPNHPDVARRLLARACGDAIERDYHLVRFDGPSNDPLHEVIQQSGGKFYCHEAADGEAFMMKLFDPIGFLRSLCPQFHERAKLSDLPRPFELGMLIDDQKYRLVGSRRSVKMVEGKLGRSYVTCGHAQLMQLLLGHLHVAEAAASGKLGASTRVAVETAAALFPTLPMWRTPLDELSA